MEAFSELGNYLRHLEAPTTTRAVMLDLKPEDESVNRRSEFEDDLFQDLGKRDELHLLTVKTRMTTRRSSHGDRRAKNKVIPLNEATIE